MKYKSNNAVKKDKILVMLVFLGFIKKYTGVIKYYLKHF